MVTSGGMECIALACAAMLEPGDAIAVEGPTYLGALMAFRGAEADVLEITMDEDGLVVDALAEAIEDGLRPKLLYVIPEYQNPTGRTLPLERREALVELCRRHGVLILEDVAYRELAFDGDLAADAVVARARRGAAGGHVLQDASSRACGSAGRPARARSSAQLAAAKAEHGPVRERARAADGRGVRPRRRTSSASSRRARELYASHWRALSARCARTCPRASTWTEPAGGFLTWVQLPEGARRDRRCATPRSRPASPTCRAPRSTLGRGAGELRLSFIALGEADLAEAGRRLAAVVRAAL